MFIAYQQTYPQQLWTIKTASKPKRSPENQRGKLPDNLCRFAQIARR
jgi:hypothetical protein